MDSDRKSYLPELVRVKPAQIPFEEILPARGLSHVELRSNESSQVTSRDICDRVRTADNPALVIVAKFSRGELTIPKATAFGVDNRRTSKQNKQFFPSGYIQDN